MKQRFDKAVIEASEIRVLLALGVLLFLRAWRAVPKLRPAHLAVPATLAIIFTLVIAASSPLKFFIIFFTGLFITLAVFMFPMLRQSPKPSAHWIRPNE